jgi:hypothetical protein
MTAVGWIGVWLLAVGLLAIAIELALMLPRALRLQRKAAALRSLLERSSADRDLELGRLQELMAEIEYKLRPYRRVRRVALHPLTVALLASYRRRRSRR